MFIGESGFSNRKFDGFIDEVRIWNDARTPTEIRENMFGQLIGTEANLVAYYPFDNVTTTNGTVGEIVDLTSNNNDGISTGMTNISTNVPIEGNTMSASGHINTSQTINGVVFDDQADSFDSSQDIYITKISAAPNITTGITDPTIDNSYCVIDIFNNGGNPGTYDVSLTFPTTAANGSTVNLYRRPSTSEGAWTSVSSAIASGGSVTFTGINSFSQFIMGSSPPPNEVPTLSEWGLIVLALLLMTLGTLYLVQPKWRMEQEW